MTDVFREVDEDLRREQVKKLWQRYGKYFIGLAVLIVVLVGGWRAWEAYRAGQAAESGDRFRLAMDLSNADMPEEAAAAFAAIANDGTAGYRALAAMRAAASQGEAGDAVGAAAAFDAIAADASVDSSLRDIARLRAGMLLVGIAGFEETRQRLEPLITDDNLLRFLAAEAIALAAVDAGDYAGAWPYVASILEDQQAPQALWTRADQIRDLIVARIGDPDQLQAAPAAEPAPATGTPDAEPPPAEAESPSEAPAIEQSSAEPPAAAEGTAPAPEEGAGTAPLTSPAVGE